MVKKVLIMLLGGGLVVGLSLPALAVGEVELHKLTASDDAAEDWFGYSVAISGTTALVGAQLDDDAGSNSGSAYLYDFSDPCNITETKLTASDGSSSYEFMSTCSSMHCVPPIGCIPKGFFSCEDAIPIPTKCYWCEQGLELEDERHDVDNDSCG